MTAPAQPSCFVVVLVTGTFNLWMRGVRPEWLASPFGSVVLVKLGVFALVLAASAVHDFVVGPRATALLVWESASPRAQRLRRSASLLGRATLVLALLLVGAGVVLVRGLPW